MSWRCEQIEASLSEYLDGLLEAEARRAFDAHVAGCAHCGPLLDRVAGLVRGMHRMEMVAEPSWLVPAILEKTLGPRETKWSAALGRLRLLLQPRFAYGAASVALTIAVLLPAVAGSLRKTKLADLRPVNLYRAADRQAHLVYARGAKFVSDLRVVYEIQSRLRPEVDAPSAPERESQPDRGTGDKPGLSNGPEQKRPRELNRANGRDADDVVLASALAGAGERSLR